MTIDNSTENGVNNHIRNFLKYYLSLPYEPEYAVLVKGKWGSGKTWFINSFFNSLPAEQANYLYVSLNGIAAKSEIEDEFFRQLHPVLASKGMRVFGRVLKSAVKTSLNFDLDGDGKSDGSVSFSGPSGKTLDAFANASKKVLVFDDLERSAMPTAEVLGYINQFVEHSGSKVIILANEEELKNRDAKDDKKIAEYSRIKEKLIGKEFDIESNVSNAVSEFLSTVTHPTSKKIISDNLDRISLLYSLSNHENLRRVRQAIIDFDILVEKIEPAFFVNEEFSSQLLSLFLIFSLEIGSGNLRYENISSLIQLQSSMSRGLDSEVAQRVTEITEKYFDVDLHRSIFDANTWISILSMGKVVVDEVNNQIARSLYFIDKRRDNWVELYHYSEMDDSEFIPMLLVVEKEFFSRNYYQLGIVLHVAGTLLELSEQTLYSIGPDKIIIRARVLIDRLCNEGWLNSERLDDRIYERDSWGGYGYHARKSPYFIALVEYADAKIIEAHERNYVPEAVALIDSMQVDVHDFTSAIYIGRTGGRFGDIPIFKYAEPKYFFDAWMSLSASDRRLVTHAFAQRYKFVESKASPLLAEVDWLREIMQVAEGIPKADSGRIMSLSIAEFLNHGIRPAVSKLTSFDPS